MHTLHICYQHFNQVYNTVIREYMVDIKYLEKWNETFQRQLASEIEKHAMNSVSPKHLNVF